MFLLLKIPSCKSYEWLRSLIKIKFLGIHIELNGKAKKALAKNVDGDLIAENQRLRMENEYFKKLNALIQANEK